MAIPAKSQRLNEHATRLRKAMTDSELLLWSFLRAKRFTPHKFRRQEIIQGYIVDFVCHKKQLIIEIDGSQHIEQKQYDAIRTSTLERAGFCVIRFWADEVLQNTDGVLEKIRMHLVN